MNLLKIHQKILVFYYIYNLYNIVVAIVGNKCDLVDVKEEVDEDEVRNYAENKKAYFCLTSALNDNGIDRLFKEVGLKVLKGSQRLNQSNSLKINNKKTKQKKCC